MAATPLPLTADFFASPGPEIVSNQFHFPSANSVFLRKKPPWILHEEPEGEGEKKQSLGVCLQFYSGRKWIYFRFRPVFYAGISVLGE